MNLMENQLIKLATEGKRLSERKFDEFRKVEVEKGIIENADGSARVRIGETDVIAGVKLDVMEPYPDAPDEGILMVSAELSPLASSDFETGPPSEDSIELARVVDRGIRESGAIDNKKLCLKEGKLVWCVNIDIQIINHSGNLLDAAALASIAALYDAKFPKLKNDKVLYKERTNKKLPMKFKPIAVTVSKIGGNLFVDADVNEEKVADASLVVTTKEDGNVCALQKMGKGTLKLEDVEKMLDMSVKIGRGLRKLI